MMLWMRQSMADSDCDPEIDESDMIDDWLVVSKSNN
jgi:hypothetical protein